MSAFAFHLRMFSVDGHFSDHQTSRSVSPVSTKTRYKLKGSTALNDDAISRLPRWATRCVAGYWISSCILAFWGLTVSQFVTNSLGQKISLIAAIFMAALMGIWTYVDPVYTHDTPERAARLARAPVMANPVVRMVFIGAMTGLITFEAVSGAVLEFWTLAFGRSAERTMHLGVYYSSSRYNCAGFKLEEAPMRPRRVICATYGDSEAPTQGTPVIVRGPASTVGIKVEQFQIESNE